MNSTVRPAKSNPTPGERAAGQKDVTFGKDLGLISEVIVTGRKVGAGRDFWAVLAHNEFIFRQFAHWAQGSIPGWSGHSHAWFSSDQLRAKEIMGENFISPWQAMKALPGQFTYTLRELLDLGAVPFSLPTLKLCQSTHVFVPGFSLTLADLYGSFPDYIMPKTMSTKGKLSQLWEKKVRAQWFLIRKQAVPRSGDLIFTEQEALLDDDEELPGLAELYYAALLCKAVRNHPILPELVRCQDTLPNGEHVCVVTRNDWHVDIAAFADDFQMTRLGIASMKKRQTAS